MRDDEGIMYITQVHLYITYLRRLGFLLPTSKLEVGRREVIGMRAEIPHPSVLDANSVLGVALPF